MGRLKVLVTVVVIMATMLVASVMPAFAQGLGPSACKHARIGQFISFVARNIGHSGTINPGNAHNPFPPFVPFVVGCNPHA